MNGQGFITCGDGEKYEGEFKDDIRTGYGVLIYSNGNKYEGEFKDDKRNG